MDTMFQIDDSVLSDPNYNVEFYSQKTIMMRELSQIKITEHLQIKSMSPLRFLNLKGTTIYDLSGNIKDTALYDDCTRSIYSQIKKITLFENSEGDVIGRIERMDI